MAFSKNLLDDESSLCLQSDTCKNTILTDTSIQCCIASFKKDNFHFYNCITSINPTPDLETFKDIIPKFEAVSKEVVGFTLYGQATKFSPIMSIIEQFSPDKILPLDINLDCQDRNLNITLEKISDADKQALKSEDHCLYYTYKSFINKASNFECSNGVLTDTIKAEGFTCGYYQFKIKVQGETAREFNTCFLYHDEIYEQLSGVEAIVKKLDEIVKDLESGNSDLEESIKKYTEAMKIVKMCNEKLESATEAVNKILKENGELEDYKIEEE